MALENASRPGRGPPAAADPRGPSRTLVERHGLARPGPGDEQHAALHAELARLLVEPLVLVPDDAEKLDGATGERYRCGAASRCPRSATPTGRPPSVLPRSSPRSPPAMPPPPARTSRRRPRPSTDSRRRATGRPASWSRRRSPSGGSCPGRPGPAPLLPIPSDRPGASPIGPVGRHCESTMAWRALW